MAFKTTKLSTGSYVLVNANHEAVRIEHRGKLWVAFWPGGTLADHIGSGGTLEAVVKFGKAALNERALAIRATWPGFSS